MKLTLNHYSVTIGGTDYTSHVPFPIKYSKLLDEQLDEGSISVIKTNKKIFPPFTLVKITLWSGDTPANDVVLDMFVATDIAKEVPAGSGKFNHEIYLVEQTKLLEGIFPRSHGYVNALARDYAEVASTPNYMVDTSFAFEDFIKQNPLQEIKMPKGLPTITLPSPGTLFSSAWDAGNLTFINEADMTVEANGTQIYSLPTTSYNAKGADITLNNISAVSTLKVTYYIGTLSTKDINGYPQKIIYGGDIVFYVSVSATGTAPQKWTIRSVIKRLLDIAIPLRKGETPRFSLAGDNTLYLGLFDTLEALQAIPESELTYNSENSNIFYSSTAFVGESYDDPNGRVYVWTVTSGSEPQWTATTRRTPVLNGQAYDFELIDAPEFQFTQSNLREVLQNIGHFIHGEPRLKDNVISFDMFGGSTPAQMASRYASFQLSQNIERFATNIDSTVGNLIDSINYARGLRTEPYADGIKALRTEAVYARVEENNVILATDRGINSVEKIEYYHDDDGNFYDITSYTFEEADYKQMSSYSEVYPYSKGYAIYYVRGAKNIRGLSFKIPNALNTSVFSRYAIVNIIRAAINNASWNFSGDIASLKFRITYQPMVAARVQQSKQNITDMQEERSLAYNQGQNVVEAHYYGENLKGLIARLGNVDRVITTLQYGLNTLPEIGTLWVSPDNEDYYVSSVATEISPYTTKTTIALTKNFNRYSEYVALDRQKRQYEISERAAYDSFYSYRDYCVIGTGISNPAPALLTNIGAVRDIFEQTGNYKPLSAMFLQGKDKYGNSLQQVALACQALAMGNAAVFSASYEDNYSAGVATVYQDIGGVSGYFTNAVPYSDFYGNLEYLDMKIAETATTTDITETAFSIPSANGLTPSGVRVDTGAAPLLFKKGSTEIPSINYQIDFVTNRDEIIIGSALAKNFILGTQTGHAAKLYLLQQRINKYTTITDLTGAQEISYEISDLVTTNVYINPVQNTTQNEYKAYVFIDGETNELLFGANRNIPANGYVFTDDSAVGLSITMTHNILEV